NTAFHYTYGRGYYEEYREDDPLADYGMAPVIVGPDTILSSNLVRQKWLDNDFYGVVLSTSYRPSKKITIIGGGGWNQYDGDHYGEVIWAEYASNSFPGQHYYDNNGLKTDFTIFGKT